MRKNITFRDITLRNSPNWTLHLQHAQHISVTNLRMENNPRLPNNDGFDCMDCHDVRLSDSFFKAGDDDFTFVGSSDLSVSNCILNSYSASVRLEDSRDATFSDLVMHANPGIGVFAREGTNTRDILFHHILIDTHLRHGHWWGKGEPIFLASSTPSSGDAGIHNVEFSDIAADSEGGIVLDATQPGAVSDILLRNIRMSIRNPPEDSGTAQGGNFDLRWTATSLDRALFAHAIPALYSRNVGTIAIDGFSVTWPDAPRDYFSSALDIEDFETLDLNAVQASQATRSTAAVIFLARGQSVALRNSTARKGAGRFLQMEQVAGPIFTSGNDLSQARVTGLRAHRPTGSRRGRRDR